MDLETELQLSPSFVSRPQRRREQLQKLVSSLTSHEVRELAELLSKVDFQTDIIARLPAELRLLIATCLDRSDIIALFKVSRTWRQIWMHNDTLRWLANRFIPGFLTYYNLQERVTSITPNLPQLFGDAAHRVHLRDNAKFQSCSTYSLVHPKHGPFTLEVDDHLRADQDIAGALSYMTNLQPFESPFVDAAYCNGRVAWRFHGRCTNVIIVDNLRNLVRRPYLASLGDTTAANVGFRELLMVLGDRLLVYKAGRKMLVLLSSHRVI